MLRQYSNLTSFSFQVIASNDKITVPKILRNEPKYKFTEMFRKFRTTSDLNNGRHVFKSRLLNLALLASAGEAATLNWRSIKSRLFRP